MTRPKKPKPWWLGAIFVVFGIAVLLTLGTWQVQRLRWKEDLLAHIAALQSAAPVPVATVLGRAAENLDFVRVSVDCPALERSPTLRLYSLHDGESVERIITACPTPDGRSLLVDRGYVATGAAVVPGRERLDVPVVGVLRVPSGANRFTPPNEPGANRWYFHDLPAMAATSQASSPLPVVLMLERPAPAQGAGPSPAALPAEISNRHLEYALTWYGLAATLAAVYIAMLLRRRTSR